MKYHWTTPYCTITRYKPIGRDNILGYPWCTVTVYGPTHAVMVTFKPMPAGMRTDHNGHEWYSREYLQHTDYNFKTEAEAKAAAEKWIQKQLKP